MKTENVKELEIVETGFDFIDLDTFSEEVYGGDNTCTYNNGICKQDHTK